MRKSILILFIFLTFLGKSQSTYFRIFSDSLNDFCNYTIEDSNSSILGVGSSSLVLSDRGTWRAAIWKIQENGDTLSKHYYFNDTSSQFNFIEQRDTNYHVIATLFLPPEYNISILQEIILDSNLNIISRSKIVRLNLLFLIDNIVRKLGNEYYILGGEKHGIIYHDVVLKTSLDFDSISYNILWPRSAGLMDCMLSQDSTKFWLFTSKYNNTPGSELIEFDFGFSNYTVKDFPYKYWPGTFDYEVNYKDNITAKWLTDSTFLVGCTHIQTHDFLNNIECSLGFSILDTTISLVPIEYIGVPDTNDYAGIIRNFDFNTYNDIIFCGTKNRSYEFFPTELSWVIAGKLFEDLSTEYLRYYGGDAYYLTHSIIPTSDGGSLIMGRRYDHEMQIGEWDVFFLKINNDGLIVNNNYIKTVTVPRIWIYPNPSKDILRLETTIPKGLVRIYTCGGVLIKTSTFNSSQFNLAISNLSSGLYTCVLSDYSGNYVTSKFIKQ